MRKLHLVSVLFLLLIVTGKAGETRKLEGKVLEIQLEDIQPWKHLFIGPTRTREFSKVPQRIGFVITGETTFALKSYVVLEDATGMRYSALVAMGIGIAPPKSRYMEVTLAGASDMLNGDVPLNPTRLKPPVKFYGFYFPCRKTLIEAILYIDNITVDGEVIDDFETDNGWHVIENTTGGKCHVEIVTEAPVSEDSEDTKTFPKRTENLISNPYFEEGISGWHHGEADFIPKGKDGKPIADLKGHEGIYKWDKNGVESFRSISMEAPAGKWAGLFTRLKDIKSNTTYTITFAYRMPRPGAFKLCIFGRTMSVLKMWQDNPSHWVRFTASFRSRNSGDQNVGFFIPPKAEPSKVWIDNVEMYEGFSPIGYDQARLHHYYYNFAYVSPDGILNTPFQYETIFQDATAAPYVEYVLELPEEVKLEGYRAGYAYWKYEQFEGASLSESKATVDGKPMQRYVVKLKIPADRPWLRRAFVTVDRRDCGMGNYSGMTPMEVFLSTTAKQGELPGYYYARWPAAGGRPAGQQPKRKFLLKVTDLVKVPPMKRFVARRGVSPDTARRWPGFAEEMFSLGFNGLDCGGRGGLSLQEIKRLRQIGFKTFSTWMNLACFCKDDQEAHGMGMDGVRVDRIERGTGYCLEYRGAGWKASMDGLKKLIDQGLNTMTCDDAPSCTCFCEKCRGKFKEFLAAYTKLAYVDPLKFMAKGGAASSEYARLWKEFQLWHYGMTGKEMREELRTYLKKKRPNDEFHFGASSLPVGLAGLKDDFAFDGVKQGFDFYTGQFYINWSEAQTGGSPKRIGDAVGAAYTGMGKYAVPLVPNSGPGLGYENPFNALDPHVQMKYQMLEMAFAAPMAGYNMYAGNDIDSGDLKYLAEFNAIVQRLEDLIIDGKPVAGATTTSTHGSVRVKQLGNKRAILVSDYTTYDNEARTEITISLPFVGPVVLKDIKTQEKVAKLDAGENTFNVTLGPSRARVLVCE